MLYYYCRILFSLSLSPRDLLSVRSNARRRETLFPSNSSAPRTISPLHRRKEKKKIPERVAAATAAAFGVMTLILL